MTRNSLVVRLSASFALTTLVLVGAGSLYLYRSLSLILMREGEDDLRRASTEILRRMEGPAGISGNLVEGCEFRVLDGSGRVVQQTPGMPDLEARGAKPGSFFLVGEGDSRHMILESGWRSGRLQLARDLRPEARRLNRFRDVLWATLGLTSVAAAIVGLWTSRRGLLPLRHLARQARAIHPESLGNRLHLEETPEELRPLVDALNRSLSRLETAFSRLAALNADMAHELRTPVHSLKVEAERLLSRRDLPPDVEDGLSGMLETLDHMGAMIGQMLFLARIEDPRAVLVKARLSAEDLLRSALEPFELLAEEAGVQLSAAAPEGLGILGDATLLRRAIHNLIDNAIRHAPEGSTVSVRAWESPDTSILCVGDQGEGIPEVHKQNLGQRFLRSDPSRSRGTGGTGLGLAIVQSIVNLHGGKLEIQSAVPRGTLANILLPRT
ncbi:ATP-binding protein [Mesoterricola silvestris]|uniref:histidine kinase n=1 Tax=Mesoterricola silvestris TaxID=2927979 RepID=A0AA48H4U9_9BACT|nr:ATP-binding protein [Mesoterricola silvestris]BDU71898.1 two-component sensor histidine kinase [Mesoterricola silvestris]